MRNNSIYRISFYPPYKRALSSGFNDKLLASNFDVSHIENRI